jgi:hypothetical protein
VDGPLHLRCDLTAERLDRAEPELAAALAWWTDRRQEALRARRERLEPRLRLVGVLLSSLGVLVAGAAIVTLPDAPFPGAGSLLFYDAAIAVFVVLGVIFWFLPRVTRGLRAWARGAVVRRALRLLASLRLHLPSAVEYELVAGRLESRLTRPPRSGATPLSAVHGALVGESLACLFGQPPLSRLLRVVWLGADQDCRALREALHQAGVAVFDLPTAPLPAPAPSSTGRANRGAP